MPSPVIHATGSLSMCTSDFCSSLVPLWCMYRVSITKTSYQRPELPVELHKTSSWTWVLCRRSCGSSKHSRRWDRIVACQHIISIVVLPAAITAKSVFLLLSLGNTFAGTRWSTRTAWLSSGSHLLLQSETQASVTPTMALNNDKSMAVMWWI